MSAGRGLKSAEAGTLEVMECDLGDLESVRAFARAFEEKHGRQLDVLVNNGERSASALCPGKPAALSWFFVVIGYCLVEGG